MARCLLIVLSCCFMMTSFVCLLGAVRYEHHEQRQGSGWAVRVKRFFVPERSGNRVVMSEEERPQDVNCFLVFLSKILGPVYDWVVTAYMNLRDPIPTPNQIGDFADQAAEASLLLEDSKFCQTECPICLKARILLLPLNVGIFFVLNVPIPP